MKAQICLQWCGWGWQLHRMFSCKSPFCYCASEWSADVTGDGWHEGCLCSSHQKRIVTASLFISGLGERQLNARSFTANDHTSAKTCTCVANCWEISASQLDLPVLKLFQEHGSRLHITVHIFTQTCMCMHKCRYMFIYKCPGTGLWWNREAVSVSHNMASQCCLWTSPSAVLGPLKFSRLAQSWRPLPAE